MSRYTLPGILLFTCILIFSCNLQAQADNSLSFDGFDDVVTVPAASGQIASSGKGFSLSCWVYATNPSPSYPNFDGIVGFRNEVDCDFYLLHLSTNTVEARLRNSAGSVFTTNITGFQINTWQHLVLTYDGSSLTAYLNGSQASSISASGNITASTEDLYLGRLSYQSTQFQLGGKLDEVALWDKSLSSTEINCMYKYGHSDDATGLKLYYKSNQGVATGNNTSINLLTDSKGSIDGNLSGFAMSGSSSNFVNGVVQHGSSSATICKGDSLLFGNQYLSAAGLYSRSISVGSCDSVVQLSLSIDSVDNGIVKLNDSTLQAHLPVGNYQWIDCQTGQAIFGEKGRSYSPSVSGMYAVVVSNGPCSDTSACVSIGTTDLFENSTPAMSVYPNPNHTGVYSLDFGTAVEYTEIRLSDASGRLIGQQHYRGIRKAELKAPAKPGVYILSIEIGNSRFVRRLVVR